MPYTIYTDPPQSRNEEILKATIDGTSYDKEPQSRIEDLLIELKAAIEGGGGSGTTNYNLLENRPQINSHTLEGDMSFADLGIDETPTEGSTNAVASGGVYAGLADKIDKSSSGYQTITGNPLEFESPSPQIVGMKCDIEPSQDLHGYDKPWAGGEGKNKLPMTVDGIKSANTDGTWTGDTYAINGVEIEIESDNGGNVVGISTTGTATSDIYFIVAVITENGTFKMLGCPSSGDFDTTYAVYQQRNPGGAIAYDSGQGTEIEARVDDDIRIVLRSGAVVDNVLFKPMITTDTLATYDDFAPYSNICHISGVDTIDIDVTGKNRLNPYKVKSGFTYNPTAGTQLTLTDTSDMQEVAFGQFQKEITAWQGVGYLVPLTSEEMYFKIHYKGSGARCTYGYLDADLKVVSSQYDNVSDLTKEGTIQSSESNVYFFFMVTSNANTTIEVDEPQIEAGTTATTYEPYVGNTYTIDLDGTRYGGQLDVGSGVLTLTHGEIASYDGESLQSTWISDRDEYQAGTTPTTGAQVVYELATPQTIQLTPTQVWAVQGGNTITVSVDGVEAEIHSSNYATLKDINDLWEYIKQSPQGSSDGVRFGASNLEMIGGTMS